MLDSIYIAIYFVAFLSFVLGMERRNLTFAGTSFILYIILWVQSLYIEVPYIAATNATNYTLGNQQHLDPAVGASCWVFICIDMIFFVWYFLGWWRKRRGEEPAIP